MSADHFTPSRVDELLAPVGASQGDAVVVGASGTVMSAPSGSLTPVGVKAGAYTAAYGDAVPADTTGGSFAVTLPAAVAGKKPVAVKHVIQGGSNVVTVACAGTDVFNKAGGSTTGTLSLLNQGFVLVPGNGIWYVVADDLPLAQLDARYAPLAHSLMPGYQLASATTTSVVNVTSTSASAPNVICSTTDITMDGLTMVAVAFAAIYLLPDAAAGQNFDLQIDYSTDSGSNWTNLGVIGVVGSGGKIVPGATLPLQHTPAAGAIRYRASVFLTGAKSAAPAVGASSTAPALLSVKRVN